MKRDNNTLKAAKNLAFRQNAVHVRDRLNRKDTEDIYSFKVRSSSQLTLTVSRFKETIKAEIFTFKGSKKKVLKAIGGDRFDTLSNRDIRQNLNRVAIAKPDGKRRKVAQTKLDQGTYYIRMSTSRQSTRYRLQATLSHPTQNSPLPQPLRPSQPRSFNTTYGYGLIDASKAVALAKGEQPFDDVPFQDVSVNDPYYPGLGYLWGLDAVKAPEAWANGYTGKGVTIAVIDTGVDSIHPDIDQTIWRNQDEIPFNGIDDDRNGYIDDVMGWDFVGNDPYPFDSSFNPHGTLVAGVIGAKNINPGGIPQLRDRTIGVAPDATIMPVRVLSDYSYLNTEVDSSIRLARGIRYAVDNGADVLNLSLVTSDRGLTSTSTLDPQVKQALQYARQNNVVVVMAAGNDRLLGAIRPANPAFSATQDLGIAVGAIDYTRQFASFSNPSGHQVLDYVVAPGVNVYTTDYYNFSQNSYTWGNGTSFAVPYVSGVVALMLQANPRLTPAQVEDILVATANSRDVKVG